ncbi:hypothetical protein M427DRAFT_233458 [Gonapodya prolifera JEL478]|uniref:SH3 domain-containing protein n=1 Tax=Gonapodya prolifera (strain JEL478) TaxID=1344416 RepID=A0A138ZY32_GONPJ|nr:hypothetical protein M427DRAFT_233458 [Gonapodya prolifera JEL478]|eukprot:KXS09371.1 hypothetical protein M427DRAFT_233458 [Gonapodya prolifera JEL478]
MKSKDVAKAHAEQLNGVGWRRIQRVPRTGPPGMQRWTPHTIRSASHAAVLLFLAILAPSYYAQSYAPDCAILEGLFTQSALAVPWTTGNCCGYSTSLITIACDGGGRVVTAHMSQVEGRLMGTIPSLAGLTNLQVLDLSNNQFVGNVPNLNPNAFLTQINLQRNTLAGNIDGLLPATLSNCAVTSGTSNKGLYSCTNNFPQVCQKSGDAAIPVGGTNCGSTPPPATPPPAAPPPAAPPASPPAGQPTSAPPPSQATSAVPPPPGSPPPPALPAPPPPPPVTTVVIVSGVPVTTMSPVPPPPPPPVTTMIEVSGTLIATVTAVPPPPPPPPVTTVVFVSGVAQTTVMPASPAPVVAGSPPANGIVGGTAQPAIPSSSSSPNIGVIAGAVAGGVAVLLLVLAAVLYTRRRKNKDHVPPSRSTEFGDPNLSSTLPSRPPTAASGFAKQGSSMVSGSLSSRTLNSSHTTSPVLPSSSMGLSQQYPTSQFAHTAAGDQEEGDQPQEPPHWAFAQLVPPIFHSTASYDVPGNWQSQALMDYTPVNTDEIHARQGDWIKLKSVFRDGWAYALNVDLEVVGLVPLDCLNIKPSAPASGLAAPLRTPSYRIESLSMAMAKSATFASSSDVNGPRMGPLSTPLPSYLGAGSMPGSRATASSGGSNSTTRLKDDTTSQPSVRSDGATSFVSGGSGVGSMDVGTPGSRRSAVPGSFGARNGYGRVY